MPQIKRISEDELVDKINSLIDEGVRLLNVGLTLPSRKGTAKYSLAGSMADSRVEEHGAIAGTITLTGVHSAVSEHAEEGYTISGITYDLHKGEGRFSLFR